jgi:hypothetical protein
VAGISRLAVPTFVQKQKEWIFQVKFEVARFYNIE